MQAKAFGENQIKNIRNHLDTRDAKYITYPKFIFLCGKGFDKSVEDSYWNTNRGIIHRYMEKMLYYQNNCGKMDLIVKSIS